MSRYQLNIATVYAINIKVGYYI